MKKANLNLIIFAILTTLLLISSSSTVLAWDSFTDLFNGGAEKPIYRLYNNRTAEHLFTADENEYNTLSPTADWNGEGVAWYAPGVIGDGVYRLYNKLTGYHLYTTDLNELQTLLFDCTTPWQPDNATNNVVYPIFYSGGSRAIYRLYNPSLVAHLLTADENEYNVLAQHGWNQEGVALRAVR